MRRSGLTTWEYEEINFDLPGACGREAAIRISRLTRREREVIERVAQGKCNKQIGSELHISHRTVEIHRANALTKMGASNSYAATRMLVESRYAFKCLRQDSNHSAL